MPRKIAKVTSDGGELLDKMAAWSDMNLPMEILRALSDFGYTSPTEIQKTVIPKALENFDIIGAAETGSGKTLAFVIPLLVGIMQNREYEPFFCAGVCVCVCFFFPFPETEGFDHPCTA